jgi:uncharacterized UBP type Zn finger protein
LLIVVKRWKDDGTKDTQGIHLKKVYTIGEHHYKLSSVIVHSGPFHSEGHYTIQYFDEDRQQWIKQNDAETFEWNNSGEFERIVEAYVLQLSRISSKAN